VHIGTQQGTASWDKSLMSRASVGRIILAVAAGYIADGILVALTEQLLSLRAPGADATQPLYYLCAEHVRQLGGANPLPNLMEVKG
jgi:hypothetical protein